MKALVKEQKGPGARLTDVPEPIIGRGEVLIKVKNAALCSSDVDVYRWNGMVEHAGYPMPVIMGHEFAGEIVKTGEDVQNFHPGDRVAGETHIPCGHCHTCRSGSPHICGNHMGVLGRTVDGCFAQMIRLPERSLIRLPEKISYREGALMEPMATAMHAVMEARPFGKSLVILGVGTIGQMALELAAFVGCTRLFTVDINEKRLEESRKRGADHAIRGDREDLVEIIKTHTGGVGADAVIDFTGNEAVINQAIDALKPSGRFIHVGTVSSSMTYQRFMERIVYRELTITGIYGRKLYETWDCLMAVLDTGRMHMDSFIGLETGLSKYQSAFEGFHQVAGRILFDPEK